MLAVNVFLFLIFYEAAAYHRDVNFRTKKHDSATTRENCRRMIAEILVKITSICGVR